MNSTRGLSGRMALLVAHVAGMVDIVALPLWVSSLMDSHRYDPQRAGALVTFFLLGAVGSSVFFAPRFERLPKRWMSTLGYVVATFAFWFIAKEQSYGALSALHVVGGIGVGCGLSFTHGTMGRDANPQRIFALAMLANGLFAVAFYACVPRLITPGDGNSLFTVLAILMAISSLAAALFFPDGEVGGVAPVRPETPSKIPRVTWYAIVGLLLMALNQAMVFSFVKIIGEANNFGAERINRVLMLVGLVNVVPPIFSVMLQRRLSARRVMKIAPIVQAAFAATICISTEFPLFAFATAFYVSVIIFTHTFVFGLIARLDPSGRAVAATPAMIMTGSAIGPFVGGSLVVQFGFLGLGLAAVGTAILAICCFAQIGSVAEEVMCGSRVREA